MTGDEHSVAGDQSDQEGRIRHRRQPCRGDGRDADARCHARHRDATGTGSPQALGKRIDAFLPHTGECQDGKQGTAQDAADEEELHAAPDIADHEDEDERDQRQWRVPGQRHSCADDQEIAGHRDRNAGLLDQEERGEAGEGDRFHGR